MRKKVGKLTVTNESSLILGEDCFLKDVDIDGHVEIKEKGEICLEEKKKNYKKVIDVEEGAEPYLAIRGYKIE